MAVTQPSFDQMPSTLWRGNALGLTAMMIWAMSFPAADALLMTWDPMALIVTRFVMSMLFLIPIWIMLEGWEAVRSAPWLRGILVGGPTFGIATYLLLVSQQMTSAVTVAVLSATLPVASTLVEVVAGERRLRGRFVLGLVLSVVGAIVATGQVEAVSLGWGAVLMLITVTLYALGSYWAVRQFPEATPMARTTLPLAGGLVTSFLIYSAMILSGMDVIPNHHIDAREWVWLLIFALAGMAISQLLWVAAVAQIGVALASFHVNATPFYVMIFMLFLGVAWDWYAAIGTSIVILGVLIAQWRGRSHG